MRFFTISDLYLRVNPGIILSINVIASISKGLSPGTQIAKHLYPYNLGSPVLLPVERLSLRYCIIFPTEKCFQYYHVFIYRETD